MRNIETNFVRDGDIVMVSRPTWELALENLRLSDQLDSNEAIKRITELGYGYDDEWYLKTFYKRPAVAPPSERNLAIIESYRVLGTYAAVGREFGISGSRVSEIIRRHAPELMKGYKKPLPKHSFKSQALMNVIEDWNEESYGDFFNRLSGRRSWGPGNWDVREMPGFEFFDFLDIQIFDSQFGRDIFEFCADRSILFVGELLAVDLRNMVEEERMTEDMARVISRTFLSGGLLPGVEMFGWFPFIVDNTDKEILRHGLTPNALRTLLSLNLKTVGDLKNIERGQLLSGGATDNTILQFSRILAQNGVRSPDSFTA